MANKKLEIKIPTKFKGDLNVEGSVSVNNSQLAGITTKSYNLKDIHGTSWIRLAKLKDSKAVSQGLVSLKSSSTRVDTFYNPIKDFTPETVLTAGTSYRFKIDYDYTDHIDTINNSGLNLKIIAGGAEASLTDIGGLNNYWKQSDYKFGSLQPFSFQQLCVIPYDTTTPGGYLEGNATLRFTNQAQSVELFITQDYYDAVQNNLENYNKVLVQPSPPGNTAEFELEDQNQDFILYGYNPESGSRIISYSYQIIGGRGRTTTNYITITPETDIQVKDILVQANIENFDYFLTSLEKITVEEVPVNLPYVEFKAVYNPDSNESDISPVLHSGAATSKFSSHVSILDLGSDPSSGDINSGGSDVSSYSDESLITENEIDLTETEEYNIEALSGDTFSSDSSVPDSSGSGSSSATPGFTSAIFESFDEHVYLDVFLEYPSVGLFKDCNITASLKDSDNLELLPALEIVDINSRLDRQCLEGSTMKKGVQYEFELKTTAANFNNSLNNGNTFLDVHFNILKDNEIISENLLKYENTYLAYRNTEGKSVSHYTYEYGINYPNALLLYHIDDYAVPPHGFLCPNYAAIYLYDDIHMYYSKFVGKIRHVFYATEYDFHKSNNNFEFNLDFIKYEITRKLKDAGVQWNVDNILKYELAEENYFKDDYDNDLVEVIVDLEAVNVSHDIQLYFFYSHFSDVLYMSNADNYSYKLDPDQTEICFKFPYKLDDKDVIFDSYEIANNDLYNFQLRLTEILTPKVSSGNRELYSITSVLNSLDNRINAIDRNTGELLTYIQDKPSGTAWYKYVFHIQKYNETTGEWSQIPLGISFTWYTNVYDCDSFSTLSGLLSYQGSKIDAYIQEHGTCKPIEKFVWTGEWVDSDNLYKKYMIYYLDGTTEELDESSYAILDCVIAEL